MPASTPTPDLVARARLVWSGLLATAVLYLVLLYALVPGTGPLDMPPALVHLGPIFLALATVQTLVVALLQYRHLAGRGWSAPDMVDSRRLFVLYVTCWVLAESIATYGLVLGLVGRSRHGAIGFFVWAISLLLTLRPRAAHLCAGLAYSRPR
ncbi:MAG: hypothetical protein U0807_03560 [Candidatus Binatia bacterium]